MARIAHLSDLHLLDPAVGDRRGKEWLRVNYLSLRRALDHAARRARAVNALEAARAAGFDQLVVTGDLAEDGHPGQYEVLAEVLAESGIPPERITLLPGNHDAYGAADGWERALAGPLAAWAPSSTGPVDLDDCVLMPMSTAVHQAVVRSSGRAEERTLDAVARLASDVGRRTVVLAQHHAPFPIVNNWVHGLLNHAAVIGLLVAHANVSVIHGHIHRRRERGLTAGAPARIFSPFAVADNAAPLRIYETGDALLHPVPADADPART